MSSHEPVVFFPSASSVASPEPKLWGFPGIKEDERGILLLEQFLCTVASALPTLFPASSVPGKKDSKEKLSRPCFHNTGFLSNTAVGTSQASTAKS